MVVWCNKPRAREREKERENMYWTSTTTTPTTSRLVRKEKRYIEREENDDQLVRILLVFATCASIIHYQPCTCIRQVNHRHLTFTTWSLRCWWINVHFRFVNGEFQRNRIAFTVVSLLFRMPIPPSLLHPRRSTRKWSVAPFLRLTCTACPPLLLTSCLFPRIRVVKQLLNATKPNSVVRSMKRVCVNTVKNVNLLMATMKSVR